MFSNIGLFYDKVAQKTSSLPRWKNKCHSWQIFIKTLAKFASFIIQSKNSMSIRQYSESGYVIINANSSLAASRWKVRVQSGIRDFILPWSGTFPPTAKHFNAFIVSFTLSERRDIVSITLVTSPEFIALKDNTEFNMVRHHDNCTSRALTLLEKYKTSWVYVFSGSFGSAVDNKGANKETGPTRLVGG